MAKLVACVIMHLNLYPEVKISLSMIQYSVNNSDQFVQGSCIFPIMIAVSKLSGALLVEIGTAYFMLTYTTITQVIGGYAKFSIIARIDDVMAKTLTSPNINISGEINENPIMMKRTDLIYDDK
jgi:hypothetical protein